MLYEMHQTSIKNIQTQNLCITYNMRHCSFWVWVTLVNAHLLQILKFCLSYQLSTIPSFKCSMPSLGIHLGCFLAIVIRAQLNMEEAFFQQDTESFGQMAKMGKAGSCGNLFLAFRETSTLISTVIAPVCIPTTSVWCSPFCTCSTHLASFGGGLYPFCLGQR